VIAGGNWETINLLVMLWSDSRTNSSTRPAQDYDELYRDGVLAIFGPGTAMPTAGLKILEILESQAPKAGTDAMGIR